MKIGDLFEASVRDLTSSGQGVVSHPTGITVFVPGIWLGERASIKIIKMQGRIAHGMLVELLDASPNRLEPVCKHHGFSQFHCGGCPWMYMGYEAQLEAKQLRVMQAFARIDDTVQVNPIIASPTPLAYRNRMQLKSEGTKLGYMANQSNSIISIQACPVLSEKNQTTLSALIGKLPNNEWRPKSRKLKWVTLDVDENTEAENIGINQRRPFQQANTAQNTQMQNWLQNKLNGIGPVKKVLELFSGSGNFTSVIAGTECDSIIAAEGDSAAINALKNKQLNQVSPLIVDLFNKDEFEGLMKKHGDADVLVLDPPRDGLKQRDALFQKKKRSLKHVLYVSCDVATCARDIKEFVEKGYKIVEIQPLDQFPQTPHVELMCYLQKAK